MPIASFTAARDAIIGHFRTEWNAQSAPVPEVLYQDDKKDTPSGNDSWARVTVLHNVSGQVTMGPPNNRRFRRQGLVTVQIFTPFGDGLTDSDIFAKVALDAFEGKETGGGDTVEFRNVRMEEIGQNGNWHQTNVIAEFEYDEVK